MKKLVYFGIVGLILSYSKAFGQGNVDVEQILNAGLKDLNTYMGYYVEPAAKGFMYSMGTGWSQTAKPHRTLGFDLKFAVSGAAVPAQYETFTFDPAEYEKIRVKEPTDRFNCLRYTVIRTLAEYWRFMKAKHYSQKRISLRE